ncbi:phosphate ABC transporter substrate-binding protein [Pseudomonas sp. MWU13-2105]|uniref:phosphate ABC transporter substrate-binding protein n=1 Tax=Pseudomonas sp. MWU13-2105 TaxID=2935074 RepID=UPI0020104D78|nr:phosphate ABC transporter substrate-binding protein [Pseudomonas sp. MWU13-2105]
MKLIISALSACTLLTFGSLANAEVAVIVNTGASSAPTQSDVANIFLGKDNSFKAVDQTAWSPTKDKFYRAVTNKNEAQLKSYWSGVIFTGKGQPLPSVVDDNAVITRVSSQADAIGYVDKSTVNDKVKVLFTLP